jgi:hypothetical protein
MEDLLLIPDFLKRDPMAKAEVALAMRGLQRKRQIRMPEVRTNPRHAIRASANRTMTKGSKEKVTYPTTEALKAVSAGLSNGRKRKLFYAIAAENGLDPTKWDHLNNGQVAMNLGNVLRGRYYKNQIILIKGKEVS